MNLHDYVISQETGDWNKWVGYYDCFRKFHGSLWVVNLFGDIILHADDDSVHYFDSSAGTITKKANTKIEFCDMLDDIDFANDMFMIPLVQDCKKSKMVLGKLQCYSFKKIPILSGDYELDNIDIVDLTVHYGVFGQITNQMKDIPDGTKITLKITE